MLVGQTVACEHGGLDSIGQEAGLLTSARFLVEANPVDALKQREGGQQWQWLSKRLWGLA